MVSDFVCIGEMLASVENMVDRLLQYVEDVMVSVGEEKEEVLVREVVTPTQYMYHAIYVPFSGWQDSSRQCCWLTANGDSFHGTPD